MRTTLLVVLALAFGLTAGGALAKGGPPPKDPPGQSGDHGNGNANGNGHQGGGKPDDPAGTPGGTSGPEGKPEKSPSEKTPPAKAQEKKAAATAKREAHFQKQTKTLGYSCKPGTTHVEGVVVSVIPATATLPGALVIQVTKGNSRGKTLVGQTITITLLTSSEVIKTGQSNQAALTVGAKVKIDLRVCTAADTDTTDGVTPTAGFVARKIFSSK